MKSPLLAVLEGREGKARLRLTYRREGHGVAVTLEKGTEAARVYRFRRTAKE